MSFRPAGRNPYLAENSIAMLQRVSRSSIDMLPNYGAGELHRDADATVGAEPSESGRESGPCGDARRLFALEGNAHGLRLDPAAAFGGQDVDALGGANASKGANPADGAVWLSPQPALRPEGDPQLPATHMDDP